MITEIEFMLDLRRGSILCDDPSIDEDIPTWLWQDMLRGSEWRPVASNDDITIHTQYEVEFELEDQRPDPNGIVPIAKSISVFAKAQIITDRCDILTPDDSTLAEDLMHEYTDEIKQHAEDHYAR